MRIGLITGEYPHMQGGVAAYTHLLAQKLDERGHEVFLLASKGAQQQQPTLPLTRIRHWGMGILTTVPGWAQQHRLDILNLQFQTAAFQMSPWVHFLPQTTQTPFVTTFHDLRFPYLFPKAGALRDWIVMHLARTSDGTIVTNAEDQQRLAHLPQIAMIPIGSNIALEPLPAEAHNQWREQAGAAEDDFLLAHFGFLNHSKGVDTLLRALAQLDERIKLVMVGERIGASDATNAAYARQIDALVASLGLEGRVTWTGAAPAHEISAYLQAADAVVLPYRDGASYRRGTLLAAIEQEAAIISTTPRVPVTDFISGENMLLTVPENPTALAEAIQNLYESPDVRQQLQRGAAALRNRFDWDHITEQTLGFYERVREAAR